MFFYILLFAFVFLLTLTEEKSIGRGRHKFLPGIILFSVLWLMSALHYTGGNDLMLYELKYKELPSFFSSEFSDVYFSADYYFWEPGYLTYTGLSKSVLKLSFYGFLILNATVFYFALFRCHKRYTIHWGLLAMFFMYKIFFYETFVAMRQSLSIALFWLILHYAEDRKPIRYLLLWLFLVFPVHMGGIVLCLVYLLNYLKMTKKRFLYLGLIFFPFTFFSSLLNNSVGDIMTLLSENKAGYASGGVTQSIFYTIEYYLIWFLIYRNFNKIISDNEHALFIIKLFLIILPCVTIFRDIVILRRIMDYFYLTVPILLGYIIEKQPKYKYNLIFATSIVCFYGFVRYLSNFDEGSLVPYKVWLSEPHVSIFINGFI